MPQVKMHDGVRSWVIDGDKVLLKGAIPSSTMKKDGTRWPGLEFLNHQFEEVHPASHSVKERIQMMDSAGISAQVMYPNILGFGGQHAVKVDDELRRATVEIFNDAMAEFQDDSKQRIFPMALMPWWDVKLVVKEIERAKKLGLRGININSDPQTFTRPDGTKLPDLSGAYWYPMWEACEALNMPINFHIGASEESADWIGAQGWPGLHRDLRASLGGAMLFINNGRTVGNLILSGLLDRFTRLRFVSVESGIGWLPFLLEAIDWEYQEVAANSASLKRERPSDYFKSNFHACFWFERRDLSHAIKAVGVDNVLFETDYPHPVCLYPIDNMDTAMSGLTEEEKVKVLSGNAAKLYNIPL
jgi:predicted TIM-barrel fold metal-dependent hydrolase